MRGDALAMACPAPPQHRWDVACQEGWCGLCMCKEGVEEPESKALAGGLKGQWLFQHMPWFEVM